MRALMKSDPWCQHYLGKAVAYRVAASFFNADQAAYSMFRGFMRDNAKSAIRWARISKGAV